MIVQIALTAIGIPVAMRTTSEVLRTTNIRAAFPGREYLAARIDVDRPFEEESRPAFEARRAQAFAALAQRIRQEPGVAAITYADRALGVEASTRLGGVERRRESNRSTTTGSGYSRLAPAPSRLSSGRSSPDAPSTAGTGTPRLEP